MHFNIYDLIKLKLFVVYHLFAMRELSRKAKLSVLKSIFVPIVTYGRKSRVMNKRVQSQMQVSEMRFLRKINCVMYDV